MKILFGHPTGNPNSHHAALSHWENEILDSFCVAWFPSEIEYFFINYLSKFFPKLNRLSRRRFNLLKNAPITQSRISEVFRLSKRLFYSNEKVAYEANDWLMNIMAKKAQINTNKIIHSYEDCSLQQFKVAKKLSKICLYDMPIGYYGWWEDKLSKLNKKYINWLPGGVNKKNIYVRPNQKKEEMELADFVLVPSQFVASTIHKYFNKKIFVIPYGADILQGVPQVAKFVDKPFRCLFAGSLSIRKGIPFLINAWKKLGWTDSELLLAGPMHIKKDTVFPKGVKYLGNLTHCALKDLYSQCDWLIHPSNFEGFSLSILEALGKGLPVLASTATGAADLPISESVVLFDPENEEFFIEKLKEIKNKRGSFYRVEALNVAKKRSWHNYRETLYQVINSI